ncbi:MAG TPA: hypothetical protein VG937_32965 [Polyangiaceae bacterium]|nr:hypothetical protein [Polyangiaceae bacterium]
MVFSLLAATGRAAHAQEASPTGKGVAGGALLGAELVTAVEAAFRVQNTWAYIGGGAAGAVAGGVGGYFIERDSSARYPMLMLAGGLTLAIPTTVAILSATAYEPPSTFVQDQPPADEPVADPPQAVPLPPPPAKSGAAKARPVAQKKALPPPALIGVEPQRLSLSVPPVEIREVFSRAEVAMGAPQATEVRIPVLNVLF